MKLLKTVALICSAATLSMLLVACSSKYSTKDGTSHTKSEVVSNIEVVSADSDFSKKETVNYIVETYTNKNVETLIDECNIDYKHNCLERLQKYDEVSSKRAIENLFVMEYGFTNDELSYALENTEINFKENALNRAILIRDNMIVSKKYTKDMLIDTYLYTEEEAKYAIDNMKVDWGDTILLAIKQIKESFVEPSLEQIKEELAKRGFSTEEILKATKDGIKDIFNGIIN